jgi:hypothetical protein
MIIVMRGNFVRAESNRMLAALQEQAGGVNRWHHNREPVAVDNQTVIRSNRDTLYSFAVVNITDGARLTLPDTDGRYLTVMAVNQDHYVNRVFTQPGDHSLTMEELDTPYVLLAARTLVDPDDPGDVRRVCSLQDGLSVTAHADEPLELPDYDEASFTATRQALLEEAAHGMQTRGMFGRKEEVDPHRHLIGTAGGWGGLPEREAY